MLRARPCMYVCVYIYLCVCEWPRQKFSPSTRRVTEGERERERERDWGHIYMPLSALHWYWVLETLTTLPKHVFIPPAADFNRWWPRRCCLAYCSRPSWSPQDYVPSPALATAGCPGCAVQNLQSWRFLSKPLLNSAWWKYHKSSCIGVGEMRVFFFFFFKKKK